MTKKEKLLKYILGLSLAGSLTLSGCTSTVSDKNRNELVNEIVADTGYAMFNIYIFELRVDDEKYFINFMRHFDNGDTFNGYYRNYIDHQDYLIKYEVSREEFLEIEKMAQRGKNYTNEVKPLVIDYLLNIVKNYDPISTEMVDSPEVEHYEA